MKLLILDDEPKSREVTQALIKLYFEPPTQVFLTQNIMEALHCISESKPHIVLLDISLREGDSFSLFNHLEHFDFELAFITAYDEAYTQLLSYCSIPCLMKPLEIDRLCDTLQKLSQDIGSRVSQEKIGNFLMLSNPKQKSLLPLKTSEGWQYVKPEEVVSFSEINSKTRVELHTRVLEVECSVAFFRDVVLASE